MSRGIHTTTGYGIDQGGGFLAVVRCTRRGRRAEQLIESRTAAPESVARVAADIAGAQRRRRGLAAAALATRDCSLRRIQVPLSSAAKARRVLPSLLDVQLPFPLDACVSIFPYVKPDGAGRVTALAMVAPKELLRRRIDALRADGFDPAVIVPEGLALWQGSHREAPVKHPATPRVVLYAGVDRWVGVAGVGRELRWATAGAPPVDASPAAAAEALAAIRRRLRADEDLRQGPIEWRWCGPAIPEPEPRAVIEAALAADRPIDFAIHEDPAAFLARALARAAWDADGEAVNLRTASDGHPDLAAWRARAEARAWIGLAAAGLALAAVNIGGRTALARRDADAQSELSRVARAVSGLSRVPRGREAAVASAAAAERREQALPFAAALRFSAADTLAAVLRQARETDIVLYELQCSDTDLTVSGVAPGPADVDALAAVLEQNGWRVETRRPEDAPADRAAFILRGDRS